MMATENIPVLVFRPQGCPCGFLGHPRKNCTCTPRQIKNYHAKISGPLLDRIDIHVEVPAVDFRELRSGREGESSASVREQVVRARAVQAERFKGLAIGTNAHMGTRQMKKYCALEPAAEQLLEQAMHELALSARAHHKILRVSRTIADLESSDRVLVQHVAEAVQYRNMDRQLWM